MHWTQHFFIEGRHFGQAARGRAVDVPVAYEEPISLLWYCARCGDCYGKAPAVRAGTGQTVPFISLRGCCRRCPPLWESLVPGSIYTWPTFPDPGLIEALPAAVLEWEFQRHCEWYDKQRL